MTKREHEGSSSIHFKHFKYHLQIEMAVSSKKNFAFFLKVKCFQSRRKMALNLRKMWQKNWEQNTNSTVLSSTQQKYLENLISVHNSQNSISHGLQRRTI